MSMKYLSNKEENQFEIPFSEDDDLEEDNIHNWLNIPTPFDDD